jgi:hypothetical protein
MKYRAVKLLWVSQEETGHILFTGQHIRQQPLRLISSELLAIIIKQLLQVITFMKSSKRKRFSERTSMGRMI